MSGMTMTTKSIFVAALTVFAATVGWAERHRRTRTQVTYS